MSPLSNEEWGGILFLMTFLLPFGAVVGDFFGTLAEGLIRQYWGHG